MCSCKYNASHLCQLCAVFLCALCVNLYSTSQKVPTHAKSCTLFLPLPKSNSIDNQHRLQQTHTTQTSRITNRATTNSQNPEFSELFMNPAHNCITTANHLRAASQLETRNSYPTNKELPLTSYTNITTLKPTGYKTYPQGAYK